MVHMTHEVMATMTSVRDDRGMNSSRHSPEALLRIVLRTNATTSGAGGVIAALAPGPVDDILGTGEQGWVRLIGIGLVLFAAVVVSASRLDADQMRRIVPAISVGDGAWVVGSVLAVALGWFSTGGAVVMGVVALMVGVFGLAQAQLVRELGNVHVVPGAT
jgi:hypothetical protein